MSEKNFSEDVRYLLNDMLKAIPDRRKAELFGVSPATIGNYKDPEGQRTPRGPKAKLFAEAIAFAKEWGKERWDGAPMWELISEADSLELWGRLKKHIDEIRNRSCGYELDDLHERVFERLTNNSLSTMKHFVLQMHKDEQTIDHDVLQRQVEKDRDALGAKYDYNLQIMDYAEVNGELDDYFKRKEQISARAEDFYALIEKPLSDEFRSGR